MIGTCLNKKKMPDFSRIYKFVKKTNVSKLIFVDEARMNVIVTNKIPQEFLKSIIVFFYSGVRKKKKTAFKISFVRL